MSHLTVAISEAALQEALLRAELEGRAVEDYVGHMVEEKLTGDKERKFALMASLPDEDVLAMADLRMSEEESRRARQLLELNREGQLDPTQRAELDRYMDLYNQGMLKKALALAEAVRRKLRPPLQ